MRVNIISMGCAKNLVDSEVMAGVLKESGYNMVQEDAEIIVVNTCGFIDPAKDESIGAILEAAQQKKTGSCRVLIVAGCLAQRYSEQLLEEIPEIDGIIGTNDVTAIASAINQALKGIKEAMVSNTVYIYDHMTPRLLSTPEYSAYIKIAEGCNNRCSYCSIPGIRGDYRSRTIESVLTEASRLVGQGVKEVNLIAQDTTRYGLDLYGQQKLGELLEKLAETKELSWIRVLYAYPAHFTDNLINTISRTAKVCRYLDIPLQHSSNKILSSMHRRGTREAIIELIAKLRDSIPELTLRTSFIVGYPGETEEDFLDLVDFIKTIKFDRMGVFAYSREKGTPAASLPGQVEEEIKEVRKDYLLRIQQDISLKKNQEKVGKIISVLIEGKLDGEQELYVGRTEADAPEVDGNITVSGRNLIEGSILPVRITHAYEYDLIGEVAE